MKEPYMLPEEDCERLNRFEMQSVRMMLAALSVAAYAEKDLATRLECVPAGNQRMTISRNQCRQIHGTMKDFEMRLVPKLTPGSTNILMTKEQGKDLLDCARWQCHSCVKDGEEARKCRLYKLLEATTPMDDYGDGMICPYALAEWEE